MSGNPFPVQVKIMMKDFSKTLCNLYIAVLAALLPLYTRGTYVMLGDAKYILFRNISLFCLGIAGVTALIGRLESAAVWRKTGRWADRWESCQSLVLSSVDVCMLCYAGCAILSALCSSYGATAWMGYREWYMGALSQVIFVGIYFFVSRQYRGTAWPVYLWEAVFFLVVLLGFCSRLGWDPLRLLGEFSPDDWEYSHLISTIGNINWFCGYCSVALSIPVAGYLKSKSTVKRRLLYAVSVPGLILLCIQGSDVGPVLAAICLGVCLLWGRRDKKIIERTLLLAAGVVFGLPCYSGLALLRGEAALKSLPADGLGLSVLGWSGWWLLGLACLGLYFVLHKLVRAGSAAVRGIWLGMVVVGVAVLTAAVVLYLNGLFDSQAWSEGRGALWRLAWQGFLRGDWKQKLLGAGPDCFAEYIYSLFTPSELFDVEGYWAGAVFANAHNQWLNHLVNTGLLGVGSAIGVAVAAVKRYRRYLPGVLALAMYGINSLVSFQQVLSTPLFFLMLGICEYTVRREAELTRDMI